MTAVSRTLPPLVCCEQCEMIGPEHGKARTHKHPVRRLTEAQMQGVRGLWIEDGRCFVCGAPHAASDCRWWVS